MPFSKENIKATSLTIGVVMLVVVSLMSVVLIARTPNPPATLYATVTGFPSMVVMQLLAMLRQEHAEREIVKTRHDLKNDLQPVSLAVREVQEQQRSDTQQHGREQRQLTVDRDDMRQFIRDAVAESMPADLKSVIRTIVIEVCGKVREELNGGGTSP